MAVIEESLENAKKTIKEGNYPTGFRLLKDQK